MATLADFFPLLMFGGFGVVIVTLIGLSWYHEKQRTEKVKQVAEQLGLPFYPQGDPALADALEHFHLFSQGHSRRVRNMIHGLTEDMELGIFDYQFTTGSGKNSSTSRQTVVYFRSAALNLPSFVLCREHMFHKLASLLGYQDIDFESHPQFSSAFLLRGSDETQIRELFRPELLAFFESKASERSYNVEGHGDELIFYRQNVRVKPHNHRGLLEEGFQLFGTLRA